MPDAFPKLRPEIDAAPAARDGETYYILYDRAGIAGTRLLVSPLGLLIAGRLDGTASVLDISDRLSGEVGGSGIACGEVVKIIDALDDALFLDSPRFHDFQEQAARDFRAAPVRAAGSAGQAYDDDPIALGRDLDRMLDEAPPTEEAPGVWSVHPRGMIVPHLDFLRGAAGYGQAYRLLAQAPRPRTVVVAGTAHMPMRERFALCDKDFETPFGPVRTDRELIERLRRAARPHGDIDRDVLAHRGEHSIELQAVWLRRVYGEDIRIVPILAGSVSEFIDGELPPEAAADDPMLRAVSDCLAEAANNGVLLMASADLAHVGPRFGDEEEVTNHLLARVEEVDRDYLECVADGPLTGLASLARHGDMYHVCGSACILAIGMALPGARAKLLGYHQAVTPEMRQAVTYAAMVFA